ncbi:hypothetical protein GGX14DRAFT_389317 [Mycena pura]|uniref:Uncharacterized protein n=1 Tax=Mycena pura TaxID=153505 RepID=A0AAD6YKL8_9AGAR|nr:hypothetical protein GGX14DRAFT_389317 [Mycena pura]
MLGAARGGKTTQGGGSGATGAAAVLAPMWRHFILGAANLTWGAAISLSHGGGNVTQTFCHSLAAPAITGVSQTGSVKARTRRRRGWRADGGDGVQRACAACRGCMDAARVTCTLHTARVACRQRGAAGAEGGGDVPVQIQRAAAYRQTTVYRQMQRAGAEAEEPKLRQRSWGTELGHKLGVESRGVLLVFCEERIPGVHLHQFASLHSEIRWSIQGSLRWMKGCFFEPSPALDAMLNAALGELSAHELMRADPLVNRNIWGPGSVLFRLLAIQHSLGEPWNLNGDTFLNIQAGRLRLSPLRAVEGLNAMWLAFDPVVQIIPALPVVNIRHNGRAIVSLQDLPGLEQRGEKRTFVGEDILGHGLVSKRRKKMGSNKTMGSKKYEPKPTPPHARRSTRLKGKKRE